MEIKEHLKENGLTLSLKGSFDEASSPEVERKLTEALSQDIKSICFDLGKVPYISSAGIRVLIIAYKKAVKNEKKVLIGDMSAKVEEILETVGILPLFAIPGR